MEQDQRPSIRRAALHDLATLLALGHIAEASAERRAFIERALTEQRVLAKLGYERSGVIDNLDPGDPELVYVMKPAWSIRC